MSAHRSLSRQYLIRNHHRHSLHNLFHNFIKPKSNDLQQTSHISTENRILMMRNFMFAGLMVCLLVVVSGFPKGPGACIGGRPAVGGLHNLKRKGWWQIRQVISKRYDDANIFVSIGGIPMTPGNEYTLASNVAHSIQVNGQDIKGLLVRAQTTNGAIAKQTMTPGSNTKVAPVCDTDVIGPSVTGISHTNNAKKSSLDGSIQFDEDADVIFDISVVFYNSYWRGASHAYGRFKVKFSEIPLIP
jgi:hypothetical protein